MLTGLDPSNPAMNGETVKIAFQANGYKTLGDVMARCFEANPDKRPTLQFLKCELEAENQATCAAPKWDKRSLASAGASVQSACKALSYFRETTPDGYHWTSKHPFRTEFQGVDVSLNTGAAGVLLALMRIRELTHNYTHDLEIKKGLSFLSKTKLNPAVSGLFVGSAGVAVALARGGELFRDAGDRRRSCEVIQEIANTNGDPDLFFGQAGIILSSTIIDSHFNQSSCSSLLRETVANLCASARVHRGIVCWVPSGILDGSKIPKTSASHGSIGIALSLGLWGILHSDRRCQDLASQALISIYENGKADSGDAIVAEVIGKAPTPNCIWCRGAAGYLWALIRAKPFLENNPLYLSALHWAIDIMLAQQIRGDPTLCHGLSGELDLALDLLAMNLDYRRHEIEERASWSAKLLDKLCATEVQGVRTWASEKSDWFAPGLWVGMLGAAYALARWVNFAQGERDWESCLFSIDGAPHLAKAEPMAANSLPA